MKADELTDTLRSLRRKVTSRHISTSGALQALNEALKGTTPAAPLRVDQAEDIPPPQRVVDAILICTNPTAPRVVKRAPRTHKRRTRQKRPAIKPTMVPPLTPTVLLLFAEGDRANTILSTYSQCTTKATNWPSIRPPCTSDTYLWYSHN